MLKPQGADEELIPLEKRHRRWDSPTGGKLKHTEPWAGPEAAPQGARPGQARDTLWKNAPTYPSIAALCEWTGS